MPSKRHSRKSHSRKRMRRKSRAYGRRRRSMHGGDKTVYFVKAWQNDPSALNTLISLGYVFRSEDMYPNDYMTTSKFVDIIDKHFENPYIMTIDHGYTMFVNHKRTGMFDYKVEIHEGNAMIGQVTLDRIPISAEPTVKALPEYNPMGNL